MDSIFGGLDIGATSDEPIDQTRFLYRLKHSATAAGSPFATLGNTGASLVNLILVFHVRGPLSVNFRVRFESELMIPRIKFNPFLC